MFNDTFNHNSDRQSMTNHTAQTKQPVIMQVIPALGAGGAEQGCIDINNELVRAGAKSIVVSNAGSRVHEIARGGGLHIELPVHSKNPITMMNNVGKLRDLIKEHNVDIVHARSRAPAWSCYRACNAINKKTNQDAVKFMTTCHAPYNISGNAKRVYNSSIARGQRVIAISKFVQDYLTLNYKIDPRIIRVIHRGIALDKFHPNAVTAERMIKLSREWRLPDEANIIMLPGRLTRWKGHHVLIEAMAKLGRPDIFCVIIGADQGRTGYRLELEEMINEHGLGGQIRIIDHCNDMPAAYKLANVVVSASTDPEGFGRVPVEAQAMGKPIIATDHGGARETVRKRETGWLVTPHKTDELIAALQEALSLTPAQRSILATRAMAHIAANFTCEKMADDTLNVYAELLEEKLSGQSKLQPVAHDSPFSSGNMQ